MKTLATAIVGIALALPSLATAQAPTTGDALISANGRAVERHGWLTTLRPDAQGRQSVKINVADLDAGSPAGHARIVSRVELASAVLCDLTADGPQFAGYYDDGARRCRSETSAAAMAQLGRGRNVSMITLGAARVVR